MGSIGVFKTRKKDGTEYFRTSITYRDKHISLGSFLTEDAAGAVYSFARDYLDGDLEYIPEDYELVIKDVMKNLDAEDDCLTFDKWIMLLNLKKSGMYCKNPIYLFGKYFIYYLDRTTELKFDADELFFFRSHKLQKRGGHIFYSDYGMQCGLLARYGVKNHAVLGRDYRFKNGDTFDFRYGNLEIINTFFGVSVKKIQGRKKYFVKIHFRSDIVVGEYDDEITAAIAYNKAADSLEEAVRRRENKIEENAKTTNVENNMLHRIDKKSTICAGSEYSDNSSNNYKRRMMRYRKWKRNYIENLSKREYIHIYETVCFAKSFKRFLEKM